MNLWKKSKNKQESKRYFKFVINVYIKIKN